MIYIIKNVTHEHFVYTVNPDEVMSVKNHIIIYIFNVLVYYINGLIDLKIIMINLSILPFEDISQVCII